MHKSGKDRLRDGCVPPRSGTQIVFLNNLRAAAILLVVVQHALSYGKHFFSPSELYLNAIGFIQSVNVPLFFLLSGYLCHEQPVLPYYRKKAFQIIIPFFVFTTAKLLFNLLDGAFAHRSSVWGEIAGAYLFGEYYWFSYVLFWMCLLAPLLWKMRNRQWILLAVLALNLTLNCCFYGSLPKPGVLQCINLVIWFPWFLAGFLLRQSGVLQLENRYPACLLCGVGALLVLTCSVAFCKYRHNCPYLFMILISFSASYLLTLLFRAVPIRQKGAALVSEYSYQIFLLDSFVKVGLFYAVSDLLRIPIRTGTVLLIALCNIALSVGICRIGVKFKIIRPVLGLRPITDSSAARTEL